MIDNYADLPLGDWLAIQRVVREEGGEDIDKQARVIAILSGSDPRDVLALPLGEYADMARKADFLTRPAEQIRRRVAKSYKAGKYDLALTDDIRKITAAQFIDFRTFADKGEDGLVPILSVFLVPKGKRYNDGYDITEVQDAIRNDLTVEDAFTLSAFFLSRMKTYADASLRSSLPLIQRMTPGEKTAMRNLQAALLRLLDSVRNGDGLTTSERSRTPAASPGTTSSE